MRIIHLSRLAAITAIGLAAAAGSVAAQTSTGGMQTTNPALRAPGGNPGLQNPSANQPRSPGTASPEGLSGAAPGSSAPGSRPATAPQIGNSSPNCAPPNCTNGTSIMAPP